MHFFSYKFYNEIKKMIKIKPTSKQFLSANQKAYNIWKSIEEKDYEIDKLEGMLSYRSCERRYYVALNPSNEAYVVCPNGSIINQATGMFTFEAKEDAELFILKMGKSINYLFPKCLN